MRPPGEEAGAAEGTRLAGYLLGVDPPPAVLERYREAQELLFPEPPSASDRALLEFAARRPWSLPFLDAAAGLVARDSRLRRKLLLMLALLETAPALAPRFEPPEKGRVAVIVSLGILAALSAFEICFGLLVYAAAVWNPAGARRSSSP